MWSYLYFNIKLKYYFEFFFFSFFQLTCFILFLFYYYLLHYFLGVVNIEGGGGGGGRPSPYFAGPQRGSMAKGPCFVLSHVNWVLKPEKLSRTISQECKAIKISSLNMTWIMNNPWFCNTQQTYKVISKKNKKLHPALITQGTVQYHQSKCFEMNKLYSPFECSLQAIMHNH